MKKRVLLGFVCVLSLYASIASASYVIPWVEERDEYFKSVPRSTSYAPDIYQGEDYHYQHYGSGDFWIVNTQSEDYGIWSFILPDGLRFDDVKIKIRSCLTSTSGGSFCKAYYGTSAESVDTLISELTTVNTTYDAETTFYNVNSSTIYVKSLLKNGSGTNGIARLSAITISASAVPEPATLGLLSVGGLGVLLRRKKR